MSEQIPLNFNIPEEYSFESMSLEELQARYLRHIGLSSRPHSNEREIIINALKNHPEKERDRLRDIDTAEDKDEIGKQYRRY